MLTGSFAKKGYFSTSTLVPPLLLLLLLLSLLFAVTLLASSPNSDPGPTLSVEGGGGHKTDFRSYYWLLTSPSPLSSSISSYYYSDDNDDSYHPGAGYQNMDISSSSNSNDDVANTTTTTEASITLFGFYPSDFANLCSTVNMAQDSYRLLLSEHIKSAETTISSSITEYTRRHNQKALDILAAYQHKFTTSLPTKWSINIDRLFSLATYDDMHMTFAIAYHPDLFSSSSSSKTTSISDYTSEEMNADESPSPTTNPDPNPSPSTSYGSVGQILFHFKRDWGIDGANIREMLYKRVRILLELYAPLKHNSSNVDGGVNNSNCSRSRSSCSNKRTTTNYSHRKSVLVPGCGMGRLALDIASAGYDVEANEYSGLMVAMFRGFFRSVLSQQFGGATSSADDFIGGKGSSSNSNSLLPDDDISCQQLELFPHLHHSLTDNWDLDALLMPEVFPYKGDSKELLAWIRQWNAFKSNRNMHNSSSRNVEITSSSSTSNNYAAARGGGSTDLFSSPVRYKGGSLSLQYGDFSAIYSNQVNIGRFDAVVTCFFIDATNDVFSTIDTIWDALALNEGVWINTGPLHYHSKHHFPFSFTDLKEYTLSKGFCIVHEETVLTSYCGEERFSMKPEFYKVPLFVAMKCS